MSVMPRACVSWFDMPFSYSCCFSNWPLLTLNPVVGFCENWEYQSRIIFFYASCYFSLFWSESLYKDELSSSLLNELLAPESMSYSFS